MINERHADYKHDYDLIVNEVTSDLANLASLQQFIEMRLVCSSRIHSLEIKENTKSPTCVPYADMLNHGKPSTEW